MCQYIYHNETTFGANIDAFSVPLMRPTCICGWALPEPPLQGNIQRSPDFLANGKRARCPCPRTLASHAFHLRTRISALRASAGTQHKFLYLYAAEDMMTRTSCTINIIAQSRCRKFPGRKAGPRTQRQDCRKCHSALGPSI